MNELLSLPPETLKSSYTDPGDTNFQATVIVQGYYRPGDGGGGTYILTNSISGTNAYGGRVLALGGAKSWHLVDSAVVSPAQFGAIPNDELPDNVQIQAASDYLANRYHPNSITVLGGVLIFDPGNYILTNTVVVGSRQVWDSKTPITYSDYDSWNPTTNGYQFPLSTNAFALGQTRLVQKFSESKPLLKITIDPRMYRRYVNVLQEDGTYADSYQASVTIRNLVFHGTQHQSYSPVLQRLGCDGIYAENVWGVTVEGCAFSYFTGHAIHFRNVSAGRIVGNIMTAYPYAQNNIVLWGCNDSEVLNNWPQGGSGPRIWITGSSCLGNLIRGNAAGVSMDNYAIGGGTCAVTNISGGTTLQLEKPHRLVTGSLVEIVATNYNQLPSGAQRRVYYAIDLGATSIGLATTMSNAVNGTAISMGPLVTNTWIWPGPCTGIYMSWDAGYCTIDNNRLDRNWAAGVVLSGTASVNIVGNNFLQNGFDVNNTSVPSGFAGGAAIALISPTRETSITGNQFADYGQPVAMQKRQLTVYDNTLIFTNSTVRMGVNGSSAGGGVATNHWGVGNTNYTEVLVGKTPTYTPSLSADLFTGTRFDGGLFSGTALIEASDVAASGLTITNFTGGNTFSIGLFSSKRAFFTGGFGMTLLQFDELDTNNVFIYTGPRLTYFGPNPRSGTDLQGFDLQVRAGAGTGNATGSRIQFVTPDPGVSGSTGQTQVSRATIGPSGLQVGPSSSGVPMSRIRHGITGGMTAGTITVSEPTITANSRILLTHNQLGTITRPVGLGVTAKTPGVSFTITSEDPTDTSNVSYMIIEP